MRILLICVLLVAGCVSYETKVLSRKIANSTKNQEIELIVKFSGDESAEAIRLQKRAAKLSEVTSGLADILGAPKDIE